MATQTLSHPLPFLTRRNEERGPCAAQQRKDTAMFVLWTVAHTFGVAPRSQGCPNAHTSGPWSSASPGVLGVVLPGDVPHKTQLGLPRHSQLPPASTAAAEVQGKAAKKLLRPAKAVGEASPAFGLTSLSSDLNQPTAVFAAGRTGHSSLQGSCMDPHAPSAAVAAWRPGRRLSAPPSAQLPRAGEGLRVCCSKRGCTGSRKGPLASSPSPCRPLAFTPSCQANVSGKSCITD